MNIIFTIITKSYVPLAESLGDSITKYNKDAIFFIIVADYPSQEINVESKYKLISAYDIGIFEFDFLDMAFKYNVTEFCTAIKPFAFNFFMNKYSTEKVIYFDPDIYLFNDVQLIFDELSVDKLCLVTPHYFTPEIKYTGYTNEEMILFVGIFNFGFFAINCKHDNTRLLIDWWMNRLRSKSYADKFDALHTDQKWMDFLPTYFGSSVKIIYHLGWNVAFWNIHERRLINNDGKYMVENRINKSFGIDPLIFIHFAGFDVNNTSIIHKAYPLSKLENHPELIEVYDNYRQHLIKNKFFILINTPYKFSSFSNGAPIIWFHRRIYRVLNYDRKHFKNPFDINEENGMYSILKKNKLLTKLNLHKLTRKNYEGFNDKLKFLNRVSRVLKFIVGFDRYALLIKFCPRYLRPENQTFLIKEFNYKFINEEIKSEIYANEDHS